jgi:phosphonate transport system ATP-binding protein
MLLEITGLRKTFDDGTRALQGIDLSVKLGEFVVILGSSGSGKTTLLRSINGLVNPEVGEIKFYDQVISSATLPDLRKGTGMIFQDFNLVNNLSSLNNVLTGLLDSSNSLMSILYLFSREQKIQALKCLEMVGLLDKAYSRVDKLSGGQKQRVGIARAIIKNPTLLLADEPVASLDPMISGSIMTLLRNIRHKIGLTVICNLHQVDLALKYSDRIVGLSGGRIVLDAPTKDLDEEYIRKIYQGHSGGLFFNEDDSKVR